MRKEKEEEENTDKMEFAKFIGPKKEGETRILRNINLPNDADYKRTYKVTSECETVIKCFNESVERNPNNKCLGSREKLSGGDFGSYKWKTYKEVHEIASNLSKGMINLSLIEKPKDSLIKNTGNVGIYSINREEWILTDIACQMHSVNTITLYDTLGEDSMEYIVNQLSLPTIVTDV